MSDPKDFPLVPCAAAPDGTIMTNASKYGRLAALAVFEMIGGTEEFARWAKDNRGDFYTKIFTKTINKDVEVNTGQGVDALIRRLAETDPSPEEVMIDAEYAPVGVDADEEEEVFAEEDFFERD